MDWVVAQLVERLICIQEAWGSTPHNSMFIYFFLPVDNKKRNKAFIFCAQ
jgi:hypothetical protein